MKIKGTDLAPEGKIYQCTACGKRGKTKYGFLANNSNYFPDGTRVADMGYDESCMLNSELVTDTKIIMGASLW